MAESITEGVIGKLGSFVAQEIALALGVTGELNKLKDTLSTVKAVLVDAEELQETNAELSVWLEALKDVCYAIDDILDEFDVIALQQQVNQRSTQRKGVQEFK